ncbi:MAG TPA: LamG domain-containing protein, partial [Isosphaeraceae bacterium]
AWVGTLGYLELAAPGRDLRSRLSRLAAHAAAGAAALGAALVLYVAFALARSGRPPDFAGLMAFQSRFYASGFYMLPMPLVGGWWLVAMVYLAALGLAAQALVEGRATPRSAIAFHLAALGIGLFAYYQGRSDPTVLTLAWWPAVLLLTLLLDAILSGRGGVLPRASRLASASAIAAALAGPAWSLAWAPGFLVDWYAKNLATARRPSPLAAEVELLRRSVRPGERVLIVSLHESLLNAALRQPSAWPRSLVESLLVADFRAMAARVERGEFTYIFLDDSFYTAFLRDHVGLPELARFVNSGTTADSTAHGRLLRPRLDEPPPGAGARLHARFDGGVTQGTLAVPPVTLGPRFTIEAVVRPDGPQAPLATILGDVPGLEPPYASGFSLQQAGPDGNAYALFTGDGRIFFPLAEFRLEPGRWTHLAIAVGDGVSTTYLDGRLVATRPLPDPMPVARTLLPVVVGDWRDRDRPFRGLIAEISIGDGVVTPDEVARHWSSASRGLEALAGGGPGVRR